VHVLVGLQGPQSLAHRVESFFRPVVHSKQNIVEGMIQQVL